LAQIYVEQLEVCYFVSLLFHGGPPLVVFLADLAMMGNLSQANRHLSWMDSMFYTSVHIGIMCGLWLGRGIHYLQKQIVTILPWTTPYENTLYFSFYEMTQTLIH
jgi:hypothetical protein